MMIDGVYYFKCKVIFQPILARIRHYTLVETSRHIGQAA
jgi:hypothetical protein